MPTGDVLFEALDLISSIYVLSKEIHLAIGSETDLSTLSQVATTQTNGKASCYQLAPFLLMGFPPKLVGSGSRAVAAPPARMPSAVARPRCAMSLIEETTWRITEFRFTLCLNLYV